MTGTKASTGYFFEDFALDQEIVHATPRTLTVGDTALYTALYGSRFALQSSDAFARKCGLVQAPVDDLLAFHIVFGKTVPDISLNAVANLGYAEGRFLDPVWPGDTLSATSRVIGLKENSSGKTGVVYVRTEGVNQRGQTVLSYVRWVMVRKRDAGAPAPEPSVPELAPAVAAADLVPPKGLRFSDFDRQLSGSPHFWADYEPGERIDHVDGMTVEVAEHQLSTRVYQNTARVHFNQHAEGEGRFGRRLIYGGHVISLARALSFNGLGNACVISAVNGGVHANPLFAGETVYAWSEVLDKAPVDAPGVAALRLRTVAYRPDEAEPGILRGEGGKYAPGVLLDLDYWALMPA